MLKYTLTRTIHHRPVLLLKERTFKDAKIDIRVVLQIILSQALRTEKLRGKSPTSPVKFTRLGSDPRDSCSKKKTFVSATLPRKILALFSR